MDVFGIRIGVDPSWFLILFLIIFSLSGSFRSVLHSSDGVAYLTAVLSALLFFASLVVHELGHALVARRQGIGIVGIDLFLFGGWAKMTREAETPGEELKVAAAGPLVTLVVVLACFALGLAFEGHKRFFDAASLQSAEVTTPLFLLLSWLTTMNVFLLVFNLVPALPLDGGRIARAVAWRLTHDRRRSTVIAARLGQGLACLFAAWGLALVVSGGLVGLYPLFFAFFFWQAARGFIVQNRLSEQMDGVRVADIMDPQPVSVPGELALGRAADEYFDRYRWDWFPVVDEAGRFVGLVREQGVRAALARGDAGLRVEQVAETEDAERWRIGEEQSLQTLLGSEPLQRFGALVAVDADGVLRGVVTMDQARRALQAALAPRA